MARFYEEDNNLFDILLIRYQLEGKVVKVDEVTFVPVEWLDWDCLRLGALGWGQIQIANARDVRIKEQSRAVWMSQLCDELLEFYPAEIEKIRDRLTHFEKLSKLWKERLRRETA